MYTVSAPCDLTNFCKKSTLTRTSSSSTLIRFTNKTNIYHVIRKGKIHENENCKIFNKMAFALACLFYSHTQLSRTINMRCCCCCNCDLISMIWLCMQLNLNSFHCERRGTVLPPLRHNSHAADYSLFNFKIMNYFSCINLISFDEHRTMAFPCIKLCAKR